MGRRLGRYRIHWDGPLHLDTGTFWILNTPTYKATVSATSPSHWVVERGGRIIGRGQSSTVANAKNAAEAACVQGRGR